MANEGGEDAAGKDLRKRRAIIAKPSNSWLRVPPFSGYLGLATRRAKLDEATYLILPSRLQMATPYTFPPVKTPPPNTSILGKHGRRSETSSETGKKGEDGGAAFSQACGLRTDFDIPEQVGFPICLRTTDNRLYNPCKQMAEQNRHVHLRPSRTSSTALRHLYSSAMRNSTVQTARCDHTRDGVCLLVTTLIITSKDRIAIAIRSLKDRSVTIVSLTQVLV